MAYSKRHHGPPNRIDARELRRTRRLLRQRLGNTGWATSQVEGGALTIAQALALALAEDA